MVYAIISDIHSNLAALKAVLDDIRKRGIPDERILCLGDVIGYGPQPAECIDMVMPLRITICGNHDWAVVNEPIGFNRIARRALLWTRKVLKPHWYSISKQTRRRYHFIEKLPHRYEFDDVLLVHGSPRNPIEEYVLRSDFDEILAEMTNKMKENFKKVKRLAFCGHSHIPVILSDEPAYIDPREFVDKPLKLKEGCRYIINVGSVGQPRDHDPRSCYVLFNDEEQTIQYRRVGYEIKETIDAIHATGELDEALAERLLIGA